ncbi:pyridoxamine 5'-phosphate oxidase family protein [Fusobacterium polymorphum]
MKVVRRESGEIFEKVKIDEYIRTYDCCRIGFYDKENDEVYIVPLNFGYTNVDNKRVFYFHGAKQGRKIDLISKSKKVTFQMDANHELIVGKMACNYSERFQCVMGTGLISFIEDKEEKAMALNEIMFQNMGKKDWEFPEAMLKGVAVFKIEVTSISCKEHL